MATRAFCRLRLESALELIANTTMPLKDVAIACGFYDQSHMTNDVKRHLGQSPARLRGLKDPSTTLSVAGATVAGLFRCPVTHPAHRDSGPIRNFVIAFPRTTGWLVHEGGDPMLITPAMATIYNRGQRYTRRRIAASGDYSDWIGISDANVARELAGADGERPFRFPYARIPIALYLRQRSFFNRLRSGAVDPLHAEEEVLALFRAVLSAMRTTWGCATDRRRRIRSDRDRVEAVLAILGSRFREPLHLRDLAQTADLSVVQLCRVFKRETGSSVHETLLDLRLRASLGAVRARRDDLAAVALDLGFSSHSHFAEAFRMRFGTTPSEWRRVAGITAEFD